MQWLWTDASLNLFHITFKVKNEHDFENVGL